MTENNYCQLCGLLNGHLTGCPKNPDNEPEYYGGRVEKLDGEAVPVDIDTSYSGTYSEKILLSSMYGKFSQGQIEAAKIRLNEKYGKNKL